MNELIKITESKNGRVVDAKELYLFLGYDITQWSRWCVRNIEKNNFAINGTDYVLLDQVSRTKEFALSIDFAKKISMMAKTNKGEEARVYFLECEKIAKSITSVSIPSYQIEDKIERAKSWIAEQEANDKKIFFLEEKNEKLQYRSDFVDVCFDANGVFKFNEVAKILKLSYGGNTLYEKMRKHGLIMKNSTIPYQKYVSNGWFKVIEELIPIGKFNKLVAITFATQKGIGHIKKILDDNNE